MLEPAFINIMATDKERFGKIVPLFKAAIIDQLAKQAAANGGVYTPSADNLKQAAFAAWNEMIESETEEIGPMLAVACWEALLKVNESAFRQTLERMEKAGTLGFKVGGSAKAPTTIAGGYLS